MSVDILHSVPKNKCQDGGDCEIVSILRNNVNKEHHPGSCYETSGVTNNIKIMNSLIM